MKQFFERVPNSRGLQLGSPGWLLLLAFFTATASADDALGDAGAADRVSALDPVRETAAWMLDQADPQTRAAAVVILAEPNDDVLAASIVDAARNTTDGAAMLWLAQACRAAQVRRQCIDAGLDAAIVRYDSANVFARAELHSEDRIADLIAETRRESMHYFALIEAWYDALSRNPGNHPELAPGDRLSQAFAIGAAWATPALAPLAETCRSATPGAELDRACQQLADRMIDGKESMLSFMIGRAIQRRGEPAGDEKRSAAQLASDRAACQMRALEPELMAMDDDGVREFIGLLKRHGEFEAWDRLAAQHDVDCSDPASQSEQIEVDQRQFETAIESLALQLLASSTDRERAAGLAYLLTADHPIDWSDEQLLDRLDSEIDRTTDGASLSWLASGCRQIRIEAFCVEAGLDTAIIEHDSGNLLSRLHVLDDSEVVQAMASDPDLMKSYASELVAVWYARLEAGDHMIPLATSRDRLGFAMANSWSTGSPYLNPLAEVCTAPSDDLEARCEEVATRLATEGRTSYERLFALEMLARQAEFDGNPARAEQLGELKEHGSQWMQCMSWQLVMNEHSMDSESTEARLAELVEFGEWVSMQRAAARLDTDCDHPPAIDKVVVDTR